VTKLIVAADFEETPSGECAIDPRSAGGRAFEKALTLFDRSISNSQEKHKPRLSKHLSLVEKIVEELLRSLKMSDGLLRVGHPKCGLYEHFMEPLFGLCVLSYPISL
jgi:hypothetical protein